MLKQPSTTQAGRVINRAFQIKIGPVVAADQPVFKVVVISLGVDSCHFHIAVWQLCQITGFKQHSKKYCIFWLKELLVKPKAFSFDTENAFGRCFFHGGA